MDSDEQHNITYKIKNKELKDSKILQPPFPSI